jgi:hypothetical protein
MRLTNWQRSLLGVLSFYPVVHLFLSALLFLLVLRDPGKPHALTNKLLWVFTYPAVDWLPLLIISLVVFYMVLIFRGKIVEERYRLDWAAAIWIFNILALPVFWFIKVRSSGAASVRYTKAAVTHTS